MRINLQRIGNRLSDRMLELRLRLEFIGLAVERDREGPWVKHFHMETLNGHKETYEEEHGQDPNFEERFERVFGPVVDSYFKTLDRCYSRRI